MVHYPPTTQYSRLATDDDEESAVASGSQRPPASPSTTRLRKYLRRPTITRLALAFIVLALITLYILRRLLWHPLLDFSGQRPTWLDEKLRAPVRLRVAVVSRPSEFELREALRESMFQGVRREDAVIEYKFFVGHPVGYGSADYTQRLEREEKEHGDITWLKGIDDVKERMSEKRWAAVKWAGSVPKESYDWFMTVDSDTFVRFAALARRMDILTSHHHLAPHNHSILVGRMRPESTYWETTVPDDDTAGHREDLRLCGPPFKYPVGIGYMMSPYLVTALLSMDPPPPHHIHYPFDDVMIGSWVAALKHTPNPSISFETIPQKGSTAQPEKHTPRPYLSEPVDTVVIDEVRWWHNYNRRPDGFSAPFSWDTVCLHHVNATEMRTFRGMEEIRGEWEARIGTDR